MDVHHADELEQYSQILAGQKSLLQKAESRQGQRPRDRKSRQDACANSMLALMMAERQGDRKHEIHSSFIP